ncbi:GGDEF domain-containing protein [Actinoplanes xinjiangensis]|uniref:GGDEF domain-containing protein n=1 Tax=Actinoplanes xinjiangensis TaxID=512350 RepID=UPI003433070E
MMLPDNAAQALVFGVAAMVTLAGSWACRRRARASRGRVARAWWAGVMSSLLLATTDLGAAVHAWYGQTLGPELLFLGLGALVANTVQIALLARPHRHRLARLTRLLDVAAVSAALGVLGWMWVIPSALPEFSRLAPVAFLLSVLPYTIDAAWALVLVANTPARRNGYAVQLLGCAAALKGVGSALSLYLAMTLQALHSHGGAVIILLPTVLVLMATTQDVPEPEHTTHRTVSLFWMSVPLMPVVLSLAAVAGLLVVADHLSMPLVYTVLGIVTVAIARQFVALVTIRRLVVKLDEQRDDLDHMAHHDALTGLPNRASFQEKATALLATAQPDRMTAVMLLDLDGFKAVNDTHGHAAGDHVLITLGERLQRTIRPSDAASRLGGDEFVVLLPHIGDHGDIDAIAARIIDRVGKPMPYGQTLLRVGVSIGIAIADGTEADLDTVLHYADNALYAAKNAGKNTYRRHSDAQAATHPDSLGGTITRS